MGKRIKRIFVQGDRDAAGMEKAARMLGQLVAAKEGWGFNLGAYGELVPLIASSGADCVCREVANTRGPLAGKQPKTPTDLPNVRAVGCPSWGTRLDAFLASDAFLFFAGRQGTLAHLVPVLAHIIKGEIDKGLTPRRVALVGWTREKHNALCALLDLDATNPTLQLHKWCLTFKLTTAEVEAAVAFLTATSAS